MLPLFAQTLYARKWPVLVIFIIMGLPFIILKMQGNQEKILDFFLLIDIIFCLLLFIWSKYISLTIDDQGIEFQIIFKKRFIAWEDIQLTKLAFEFHGKSSDFIWSFISIQNKTINISVGYFSKKDLRRIAEAVLVKCPEHTIRGKIKE